MSVQTITYDSDVDIAVPLADCRVWERFPSDLDTSCQPLAARGADDLQWPAKIREISAGGIGLVLQRRFERGVGLAIELPDPASKSTSTVLARVVHATARKDGSWLLGCAYLNPLSQETLEQLLEYDRQRRSIPLEEQSSLPADETVDQHYPLTRPAAHAPPSVLPAATDRNLLARRPPRILITGVRFQGTTMDGCVIRQFITRLYLVGPWPLDKGTIVSGWVGRGRSKVPAFKLAVQTCTFADNQWALTCRFIDAPAAKVLPLFRSPASNPL